MEPVKKMPDAHHPGLWNKEKDDIFAFEWQGIATMADTKSLSLSQFTNESER